MPKGLSFCFVVLQKLKNKTKMYSLIDMHHQKWLTDKNNRPKIEKRGIGKDKLMIKSTKVQPFVLLACENSYTITKTHTPIFKPHDTCQTKLKTNSRLNEKRESKSKREKIQNPQSKRHNGNGKWKTGKACSNGKRETSKRVKHQKE